MRLPGRSTTGRLFVERLSLTNRGQGVVRLNDAGARQVCATAGWVFVIAPTPAQRGRRPISARKRNAFLEALKEGFSITHAAKKAGIARQRMYELRSEDGKFAIAWLDAWEQGTDVLEDELRRRRWAMTRSLMTGTAR